jgi:hypothetical protein
MLKPYPPPVAPTALINVTDPDSRVVRTRPAAAAGLQRASGGQRAPGRRRRRDHRRVTRLRPPRTDGETRPDVNSPAGARRPAGRARRRGLLAPTPDRARRFGRHASPRGARRRPAQRHPARLGRRLLRLHAPRARHARRADLYRQRQVTVEPVFGQIKFNRAIKRFQRRGRAACRSEWRLITATHNLLKLHNHRIAAATP